MTPLEESVYVATMPKWWAAISEHIDHEFELAKPLAEYGLAEFFDQLHEWIVEMVATMGSGVPQWALLLPREFYARTCRQPAADHFDSALGPENVKEHILRASPDIWLVETPGPYPLLGENEVVLVPEGLKVVQAAHLSGLSGPNRYGEPRLALSYPPNSLMRATYNP